MLNQITIMGRLTRDPEYKTVGPQNISVASFTVAVDRDLPDKSTGKRETDFIDCEAWRQTAEFITKYFQKGSMIALNGRLQIKSWTDKDGNKRKSAVVLVNNAYFGESKSRQGDQQPQTKPQGGYYQPPAAPGYGDPYREANAIFGAHGLPPVDPGNDYPILTGEDQKMPWE